MVQLSSLPSHELILLSPTQASKTKFILAFAFCLFVLLQQWETWLSYLQYIYLFICSTRVNNRLFVIYNNGYAIHLENKLISHSLKYILHSPYCGWYLRNVHTQNVLLEMYNSMGIHNASCIYHHNIKQNSSVTPKFLLLPSFSQFLSLTNSWKLFISLPSQ